MTAALVLKQTFRDGTPFPYKPPRDTCDRELWSRCQVHHLGCDCREAEQNEQINELRYELKMWQEACARILAGHPTSLWTRDGMREVGCQCTGCEIARACHWYGRWTGELVELRGSLA